MSTRTRTALLSPRARKAVIGTLCAVTAALTLWAAALGAMALTPPADTPPGAAPETVYRPTGLISAQPDADGKPRPALQPALKPASGR